MNYKITPNAADNIVQFYENVAKKYSNTYSKELMNKNIDEAISGMYQIETSLLRRVPSIDKWKVNGYFMAKFKMWYYGYIIQNDTVIVKDSRHSQNMRESIVINERQLRRIIVETIRKVLQAG